MATQSGGAPPFPTDGNPQNLAAQLAPQTNHDQQESRAEAPKQNSTPTVFVNSEPMREEQVQNAVKFLSHPKVKGSPVIYRRSFLEKKGLTKEEIDEAFRRVPDPPPSAHSGSDKQEEQIKSLSNNQPQVPIQILQPAVAASTGTMGTLNHQFKWSHAVYAVGLLAASGAGTAVLVKNAIIPRLKSWIRKVVLDEETELAHKPDPKPSLEEEAAAAAKAAAAAAADVAKASQEMAQSRNDERRYFEGFTKLLDVQLQEMKSMTDAIRKLEGQTNNQGRASFVDQEDNRVSISSLKQPYLNGKMDYNSRSVRSSSPSTNVEPSITPHSKSYTDDIEEMIQSGEIPPNINDINDLLRNPYQQPANPHLARTKPWEVGQAQNISGQALQSQVNGEGSGSKVQQYGGIKSELNGDNSVPWWQQKNVKVTNIENDNKLKSGSYGLRTSEQPVQHTWVPPQPPTVAMLEAAEAIRRPKPSLQTEQLSDDRSVAHPSDEADELQRITKMSESGGPVEINGGSSALNSSEIQEDGNRVEQS